MPRFCIRYYKISGTPVKMGTPCFLHRTSLPRVFQILACLYRTCPTPLAIAEIHHNLWLPISGCGTALIDHGQPYRGSPYNYSCDVLHTDGPHTPGKTVSHTGGPGAHSSLSGIPDRKPSQLKTLRSGCAYTACCTS